MRPVLIEEQPDLLVFNLPSQADWFSIVLLPVALCGFIILVFLPLYGIFSGNVFSLNPSVPAFALIIFGLIVSVLFAGAGFYWIYNALRINFGREILKVTGHDLTLELRIFRFSRGATYSQREVWQLRLLEKERRRTFYRQSLDLDLGSYTLAFDHDAGTAFFGASISEKGAAEILEIICDKFPQYKPREQATRHRWTPPRAS